MEETEVETVMRLRATDVRDLFPDISADDALSRICLLCAMRLKDKTHNLTRHLERHHLGARLQLMEQRRTIAADSAVVVATTAQSNAGADATAAVDSNVNTHTPVNAGSTARSQTQTLPLAQLPRSASRRRAKRPAPAAVVTAIAALSDSLALDALQTPVGGTGRRDTEAASATRTPTAVANAQPSKAVPSLPATPPTAAVAPPTASAAVCKSERSEAVERAARALARWLAVEQLPLSVVATDGFERFVCALNADFAALGRDAVQHVLAALQSVDSHGATTASSNNDARAHKRSKRAAQLQAANAAVPAVTTRALVARCRIRDDVPLVQYEQLPCRALARGWACVRVRLARASHSEQQICCGRVTGRQGVLGRAFVGVVERVLAADAATISTGVCIGERVVLAMPALLCDACAASGVPHCTHDVRLRFGETSPSGALTEWLELPVANLVAVPSAVSDDLALLADDVALALQIAKALESRSLETLAVVTDGAGGCALALFLHHVRYSLGLARDRVHVLATAALSKPQRTRLRALATLTALDVHDPSALDDVLSEQPAFGAVVDLCATEASCEFAISLVEPMGAIVLVDRASLHVARSSGDDATHVLAMDMNALVVNELELLSISDCATGASSTAAALAYLAAQSAERCAQLRTLLLPSVALDVAQNELLALPDDALLAQHLVVRCSESESMQK